MWSLRSSWVGVRVRVRAGAGARARVRVRDRDRGRCGAHAYVGAPIVDQAVHATVHLVYS